MNKLTISRKETGRSMIEMLGVLAIIGVLSAGGIMGYSAAMDAYTFNKFVKDAQNMAAASLQAFPKLNRSRTDNAKVQIYGESLYRLGILPADMYNSATDKTTCYVKNPFTGKQDFCVQYWDSWQSRDATVTVTSNLGSYTVGKRWASSLELRLTAVPKKVCVKMLTFDWRQSAPSYYAIESFSPIIVTPVTTAEAEGYCTSESNSIRMFLYTHVSKKPNWQ